MSKKYRFLIEKWSNQPVIELTEEEKKEFDEMNTDDKAYFLECKCPVLYDVVNVELNEVKRYLEDTVVEKG
jgi:hypothetical protein